MQKLFIQNRKKEKVSVNTYIEEKNSNLVFVMHGLGGSKEQPLIKIFIDSFLVCSYNVVSFDTTSTFGKSDGKYELATTTNYYEDLEDVILWAKKQPWYKEPYTLIGHSLGGFSIGLYAENYPDEVRALAPISTVVSGKLSITNNPESIEKWKKDGWKISERKSAPGKYKKLPWSHMEDRLEYDLLDNVGKLKMPILMIVGENDESTPVEHQKLLYKNLPGRKELYIVSGAEHTFMESSHLDKVKSTIVKWIKSI